MTKNKFKCSNHEVEILSKLKTLAFTLVDPAPTIFDIFDVKCICPKCGRDYVKNKQHQ